MVQAGPGWSRLNPQTSAAAVMCCRWRCPPDVWIPSVKSSRVMSTAEGLSGRVAADDSDAACCLLIPLPEPPFIFALAPDMEASRDELFHSGDD